MFLYIPRHFSDLTLPHVSMESSSMTAVGRQLTVFQSEFSRASRLLHWAAAGDLRYYDKSELQ